MERHPPTSQSHPARLLSSGSARLRLVGTCWIMAGAYLDAWAHRHGTGDQGFVSPWHAVLYSGLLLVAIGLPRPGNGSLRNPWRDNLPAPAGWWATVGFAVFAAGGVIDALWHGAFRAETSSELLVSPPHLLLGVAVGLIVTDPLRGPSKASLVPDRRQSGWQQAVASAVLLALVTYFLQDGHPYVELVAAGTVDPARPGLANVLEVSGVAAIVLHSLVVTAIVWNAMTRFELPAGSVTLIVGMDALAMAALEGTFLVVPAAVFAGLSGDLLVGVGRRGRGRPPPPTTVAVAVLWTGYFAALAVSRGISWSVHLVWGSVLLGTLSAWLVGCLLRLPPHRD